MPKRTSPAVKAKNREKSVRRTNTLRGAIIGTAGGVVLYKNRRAVSRVVTKTKRVIAKAKRVGISKAVKNTGRYKGALSAKNAYRTNGIKQPIRSLVSKASTAKRGDKMYTKGFRTFTATPVTNKGTKRIAGNLRRYGRAKGFAKVRHRGVPSTLHKH
jgi:hypothetical protein